MGFSASIETIAIEKIRIDGGTQSRAAINDDVVSEYADVIKGGDDLPPITVYFDGKEYWLSDGFHRTAAYQQAGAFEVQAEVRQGDKRDAVLHSVGVNAKHGLRRTRADKRRAVEVLLRDAEWSQWSDREIARRCGVYHQLVATVRNDLTGVSSSEDSSQRTFTTKHGTTSTMNTANIGSKKPDAEPKTNPVASEDETSPPEPEPPRKKSPFADLTREALEDDLAGMVEENADLKNKLTEYEAEVGRLKEQIKNLSSDDKGAIISKLDKQRIVLKGRLDDAMTATKREEYKRKNAEKRIKELEDMEIPL